MNTKYLKAIGRMGASAKEFSETCKRIAATGVTAEELGRNITENLHRLRMPLPPKV